MVTHGKSTIQFLTNTVKLMCFTNVIAQGLRKKKKEKREDM